MILNRLMLYGLVALTLIAAGLGIAVKVQSVRLASSKAATAQLRADNAQLRGELASANQSITDQNRALELLQQQAAVLTTKVQGARSAQDAIASSYESRIKALLAAPAPKEGAAALSWAQARVAEEATAGGWR